MSAVQLRVVPASEKYGLAILLLVVSVSACGGQVVFVPDGAGGSDASSDEEKCKVGGGLWEEDPCGGETCDKPYSGICGNLDVMVCHCPNSDRCWNGVACIEKN